MAVNSKFFCSPIIEENVKVDLDSADYKVDSLSLLVLRMIKDKKSVNDIADVLILPVGIVEDAVSALKEQNLLVGNNELSPVAIKILDLKKYMDKFNGSAKNIVFEFLSGKAFFLPDNAKLTENHSTKNFDAEIKILDREYYSDFQSVTKFVDNVLEDYGAAEYIDDVKPILISRVEKYIVRELLFFPVIGEKFFENCTTLKISNGMMAKLPIHKYEVHFAFDDGNVCKNFAVDLVVGSIFELTGSVENNSERFLLSFSKNVDFDDDELVEKLKGFLSEKPVVSIVDLGVQDISVIISEKVIGDYLCV